MNDEEDLETGLDVLRDTVGDMAEEDDESEGGPLTAAVQDALTGAAPAKVERPVREMLMRELEEARNRLVAKPAAPSSPLDRLIERFGGPTGKSGSLLVARRERDIQRAKEDEQRRADLLTLLSKQEQLESAGITEQQRIEAARARAAQTLGETPRTRALREEADIRGITVEELLEIKDKERKKAEGPSGEAAQFIWAERTLDDPNASPAERRAAARLIERKTPFDIRKSKMLSDKNSANYLSRIKQQNEFTIPIIDEAISQAEEGGSLVTGNLSKWVEGIPWIGQDATDLERTLDAIKSNIGFEKLAELKELSPSGASGLGAVSNAEQILLQSVRGSISRDQSKENLVRNLQRIKDFYQKEIFQILERETGMRGITDINEAINVLQNKEATSAPSIDLDAARKALERKRAARGAQ